MTNPEDFLKMQINMKRSQEDYADFMSDLSSWEKTIKAKDHSLKIAQHPSDKPIPPVRRVKKQKLEPTEKIVETPKPKIKSYDYRAWDKYDVDAEVEKVDREIRQLSTSKDSSDEDDDEESQIRHKRSLALFYKDQGNREFKSNRLNDCIRSYTLGIESDPTNALLYSNRAMAYLSKEMYKEAESDCTLSIEIDPSYTKSFLRRATARFESGDLTAASEDFSTVLKMESNNKQAQKFLSKINKIKESASSIATPSNVVLPIKKKQKDVSKRPLRRIPIEVSSKKTENCIESLNDAERVNALSSAVSTEPLQLTEPRKLRPTSLPSMPSNEIEFMSQFNRLKAFPDLLFQYLKLIPPKSLPSLISVSLFDASFILTVADVIHNFFIAAKQPAFEILFHIAKVPRFSMIAMFFSGEEKSKLKNIILSIGELENQNSFDVNNLLKKYNC